AVRWRLAKEYRGKARHAAVLPDPIRLHQPDRSRRRQAAVPLPAVLRQRHLEDAAVQRVRLAVSESKPLSERTAVQRGLDYFQADYGKRVCTEAQRPVWRN